MLLLVVDSLFVLLRLQWLLSGATGDDPWVRTALGSSGSGASKELPKLGIGRRIRTQAFNRRSAPRIFLLFVTASPLDFHIKQKITEEYSGFPRSLWHTTAAHRLLQRQRTNKRKRGGGIADEGRKTWGNPVEEVRAGPAWMGKSFSASLR